MSEPREPETEHPKSGEHRRLAEGLRHEIEEVVEEVVEHVPRPIRWTVGKLVRLTFLVLAGLVLVAILTAALYVMNRTEWAARELALLTNQALSGRSDISLAIGDIKGNPLTGVRVLRARVRFRDGDQPPLLEAPEIRLRYSAWALVTGGRGPVAIEIDRPVIRLAHGPDGRLRLPVWKTTPGGGPGRVLDLTLRIRGGALVVPDTARHVRGVDLDAVATTGRPARVEIRSLRWTRGPFASVVERAAIEFTAGDSLRVAVRELRTRDLALRGRAAWAPGDSVAAFHVEVDRLRWRWLYTVTGNRDLDVPGEGRVVVSARGGRDLAGRFEASGVWDSLVADARGGFAWREGRLRVEPLVAHSRAGDLDGALSWSGRTWEIAAEVRRGDPAHWSVLGIRGWPAGDLNGRFRYAVETRTHKQAWLSARLTGSEWAGWQADSGVVEVDFTPVGPDSFAVRVLRRGGEMRLRAITDSTGWTGRYQVARYPLDEWAEGRASGIRGTLAAGQGTVDSREGSLRVTGTLEGGETDWLGIHTARWRMRDMRGALLPVPDLAADVGLEDLFFLAVHWDSAAVPIHVGDGRIELPALAAFAGDTVLAMDARAEWDREGWRLTADSASARSGQFAWTVEPPLRLSGDPRGVTFDRLQARDGEARLAIEGRWAGPGGEYDWTARAARLDLGRLGLPPAWGFHGTADAELRVTGVPGNPHWAFRGSASRPGTRDVRVDSLWVLLAGGPSRFEVREGRAMLDGGSLSLSGEVTAMPLAWPDTLTGEGITRWIADAGRWSGVVRGDRIPLERLVDLAPAARGWKGRGRGTLEVAGRPGAPDLVWSAEASPLGFEDYLVDHASARGRQREGRLEVSQLQMTRQGVVSTVAGSMPLRLAVGRRPEVPEEPMEWRVDLPNGDLALVPLFVPQIGSAAGRFDLTARLGGTPQHPDLSGTARIREGRARMAGREEVLEGVTADLRLDESRITLESLTARQRKRQGTAGTVTGRGVVELEGMALKGYRFDLRLRDFAALESGVYGAEFDGEFVVTNGPKVGGATLPLVEGTVELRRAVVLFDFANQSQLEQVAAATQPLYWLYRIQLNATDNLRWQPSAANIEFSADLRLEQTPDSLIIYGDMTSLRGSYYYLSSKFDMERVNLTFDNVGGVNPKLDIVAVTRVPRSAGEERLSGVVQGRAAVIGNENITVTVTGRASEPVMSFASDGGWDQPTILRALTYGPRLGQTGIAAGADLADDWVTRNLNRQLSAEVSRLFQGYLGDLEVTRESGGLFRGEGDLVVGVGIPLSPSLGLRYRERLGSFGGTTAPSVTTNPFERDVEAQYRISRFFYISSGVTQRRVLAGTAPTLPEFNVNLKARWEY